nr:MAG TPA: hypothetical protein [Caudoviricetes sp.]
MKNYAMIAENRVIGVLLNQETEPEWGATPDGSPVLAIPCDDTVTLGMIYDPETEAFSEYIPPEPEPTPEPQLTETEQAILDTAINVDYLVCMKELEI